MDESVEFAIQDADAIVFCTAHTDFRQFNFENLVKYVNIPAVIIDTHNIFDQNTVKNAGFAYRGLGVPSLK